MIVFQKIVYLRAMNHTATYPPKSLRSAMGGYRYFFNGQEGDGEVYGQGSLTGYEFRQYDTRLGRWWGVDRKQSSYIGFSPFIYSLDNPISLSDVNGEWVRDQNGNIVICYSKKLTRKKYKSYSLSQTRADGRTESYSVEGQWGYILSNNGTKVEVFVPSSLTVEHSVYDVDESVLSRDYSTDKFDPSKNCTTNSLLPNLSGILIDSDQITEEILLAEGYVKGKDIEANLRIAEQSGDPAASNKSIESLTQIGDIVTYTAADGCFDHFEIYISATEVDTKGGFQKGPIISTPMSNDHFGNNCMIWFNLNVNGWQDVIKNIATEYSTGTGAGLNFVDEKYFNKLRDEVRQ